MEEIIIPSKIQALKEKDNESTIVIEPCFPGYGHTLGNALRRILLSSLQGAAITAIKIKGVDHEFTAIENIKESVIDLILNVKKIRVKSFSKEPVRVKLSHKGKGEITAKEIKATSDLEIINKGQIIASATSKDANLEMEFIIEQGMGYLPVEQRNGKDLEIGMIAVDAIFSPVIAVGYKVENTRVGQRTDYDKLILNVKTDGSIDPLDAIAKSAKILVDQFSILAGKKMIEKKIKESKKEKKEVKGEKKETTTEAADRLVSELKLSTRTYNALDKAKIRKVKDLIKKSEKDLLELEGFGETALKEIKKELKKLDLKLKA